MAKTRSRTGMRHDGLAAKDRAVPPEQLRWVCDGSELPFETTEQVPPLAQTMGQERGVASLDFGLEAEAPGFNVFVAGPAGTGRMTASRAAVERLAEARPTPGDWCYVHNFEDPARPLALSLPAGGASRFAEEMANLVKSAQREVPRTFEGPEYRHQQEEMHRPAELRREQLIKEVEERARAEGLALSMTPAGVLVVPLVDGRPMTAEEASQLPEEPQQRMRERGDELSQGMREATEQVRQVERDVHEQMAQHELQTARLVIEPLIRECQSRYQEQSQIAEYLDQVCEDMISHADELRQEVGDPEPQEDDDEPRLPAGIERGGDSPVTDRYGVNVLADNRDQRGAPVVAESYPTYYNLLGRVEYQPRFGAMVTDYRMIKPGALHRANGGYLLLNATDLLSNPFAWDVLKRTLRTGQVRIENIGEQFSPIPAATLRPEPIPLDVKVVLVGPPLVYFLLHHLDEDFSQLFQVRADFDTELDRTSEHVEQYAGFISRRVRERNLSHFHRSAVAKFAEHGARLREHQERLSAQLDQMAALVDEAAHWAERDSRGLVMAEHVQRAIDQKTYRSNLVEEKVQRLIDEGTIFIDTDGVRVGQVNGLSTLSLGDYVFGRPMRITAQTALGGEGVLNLERETQLSGPIHNKGFLALGSFLMARYAQDRPLALTARITFEQTYEEIEGDSASSSELYALLSSLSGLGLRQDIGVTGSINQLGEVQPVGGVTHKIEGFFAVCRTKGLTGSQGVIIPAASVRHLMLREEVVEAVREGQFHVWAVRTIDEGIEVLTGVPAGQRCPDGSWEEGTVNARVDQRLRQYAERLRDFARAPDQREIRERTPAEVGPHAPRVRARARRAADGARAAQNLMDSASVRAHARQ